MGGLEMHYLVLIHMAKQIMIMSHLIACCWNLIQQYEMSQGITTTWLEQQQFIQYDWWGQYIMCFYWSTATIMLIGTSGTTILETVYCNFILFFTVGIFAYILENIAQTIKSITKDSMEYKGNLETLNKYMRNNNLDYESQAHVRQQLSFIYKSSQKININKQAVEVLGKLPENLSINIKNKINSSIIKKFTPLTKTFSPKIIEKAYQDPQIIQEISFVSQEIIFNQNDPLQNNNIYIYLVLGGEVELFYQKKNQLKKCHKIKTIKSGQLFGIQSFFSGQIPQYSARSLQFSNVCRINRSGFINLLKYSQQQYEKFCYIQDYIMQHGVCDYFKTFCEICNRNTHQLDDCNLLNYNPKRYRQCLVDKYQKAKQQSRLRYFRDNEHIHLKQMNCLNLIDMNTKLNLHFNTKYIEQANINHMYYKMYITQQTQIEYISDSYSDDSEYSSNDTYTTQNNFTTDYNGSSIQLQPKFSNSVHKNANKSSNSRVA